MYFNPPPPFLIYLFIFFNASVFNCMRLCSVCERKKKSRVKRRLPSSRLRAIVIYYVSDQTIGSLLFSLFLLISFFFWGYSPCLGNEMFCLSNKYEKGGLEKKTPILNLFFSSDFLSKKIIKRIPFCIFFPLTKRKSRLKKKKKQNMEESHAFK